MRDISIAVCGLGTIGSSVVNLLNKHNSLIKERHGFIPRLVQVGARRPNPACPLGKVEREKDIFKVAQDQRSKVLIELIGGVDDAYKLTMLAFKNKKHVITANKALIAAKGDELFKASKRHGVGYFYEASVAGGIPIIKVIKEGLAANKVNRIVGIVNGTSNYILTEMAHKGASFDDALKQAQELGYAEADPSFDINGSDAAHKISILASLAFGAPLAKLNKGLHREGIDRIEIEDIKQAAELGFVIKHLAIAEVGTSNKINARVHPTLVRKEESLASVESVTNGIVLDSYPLGLSFYSGAGAGGGATASAVLADLVDAANWNEAESHLRMPKSQTRLIPLSECMSEFYLRMQIDDKPGVLAKVTDILGKFKISIEAMVQKEHLGQDKHQAPVIIITHKVQEKSIDEAIKLLVKVPQVNKSITQLRILS